MILSVFFILIPAGVANIMASLSRYIFPRWTTPIDFGRGWFGAHKTWRGLVCGIGMGVLLSVVAVLISLTADAGSLEVYQWHDDVAIFFTIFAFFSFPVSVGALLGDLLKSFLKRRFGIAPGKPWIPFDQLDWILGAWAGAWAATWFISVQLHRSFLVWTLLIGGLLHMLVNFVAYRLHLQKNWL